MGSSACHLTNSGHPPGPKCIVFLLRGTSGAILAAPLAGSWAPGGTWLTLAFTLLPYPPHPFPLVNPPPFSHPRADLCGNLVWQVFCTDWLILLSGHRLRAVLPPTHAGLGQGWVFNPQAQVQCLWPQGIEEGLGRQMVYRGGEGVLGNPLALAPIPTEVPPGTVLMPTRPRGHS